MDRRALLVSAFAGVVGPGLAHAGPLALLGAGKPSGGSPPPEPPINTSAPVISGIALVGETLSTSTGTWTNTPTGYTYQWKRDGSAIGGATASTRLLAMADDGAVMTAAVVASNGVGAGSPATSAGVGPVGSAPPASIATPVVGTDLTPVWNLQFGGTGPRTGPTNGTWAGWPDTYLIGRGFILGNDGALYLDVGASAVTVANYDFADAPAVHVNGAGSATFNDCSWAGDANTGVNAPKNINGDFIFTGSPLVVTLNYCDLNASITYLGCGTMAHNHCRIRNQVQIISSTGFNATGASHLSYDWCFITGGGVAPAAGAHVEDIQSIPNTAAPTCTFSCTNTLVYFLDGQALTLPWGSAWTGIWSVGKVVTVLASSVFIGITEVNANPANPDVINCVLAYGTDTGTGATVTNCAMEAGRFGYTLNQNGTANRPVNGGGNRTFATNVEITTGDFG